MKKQTIFLFGLIVCGWGSVAPVAVFAADTGTVKIEWEAKERFRMFRDPRIFDVFRKRYERDLTERERSASPTQSMERILAANNRSWASVLFDGKRFKGSLEQNICRFSKEVSNKALPRDCLTRIAPGQYDVIVRTSGAEGRTCIWTLAERTKSGPCSEPVEFAIPKALNQTESGVRVDVAVADDPTRRGEAFIKVVDQLIVGLGDSFGAGEGNPDIPAAFKGFDSRGDPKRTGEFEKNGSIWLDRPCHRSFYSPQFRAALGLALADPHKSIMFIGLACSGARIQKGMYSRYGGVEDLAQGESDESQLSTLIRLLCKTKANTFVAFDESATKLMNVRKCLAGFRREIDTLFLSIGGNDVGFAGLIANTILVKKYQRAFAKIFGARKTPGQAMKIITRDLRPLYEKLNGLLQDHLHIPGDRVYFTAYPNPLNDQTGTPCGSMPLARGELHYDAGKARGIVRDVIPTLYRTMGNAAEANKWRFVAAAKDLSREHGWCALAEGEKFGFPDNPSAYRPYEQRIRWFRTPSDAYLAVNNKIRFLDRVVPGLVKIKPYTSGAFHPTAQGQAAVADEIIRAVNGQRP